MTQQTTARRAAKGSHDRRRDILTAALDRFHDAGFDATTVQHIASAAGVAAGTVYLYFASKEHVLLALHDEFHHGMQADMQAALDAQRDADRDRSAEAVIDGIIDAVVAYLRAHRRETAVICRYIPRLQADAAHEDRQMARFIGAAIEFGTAAGRVHVSDPQMAGELLFAALSRPLSDMVVDGTTEQVDRLVAQAKELFRKALAPQPSR